MRKCFRKIVVVEVLHEYEKILKVKTYLVLLRQIVNIIRILPDFRTIILLTTVFYVRIWLDCFCCLNLRLFLNYKLLRTRFGYPQTNEKK